MSTSALKIHWFSLALGIAMGAGAWFIAPEDEILRTFLGVLAGVAVTLLGFLVAALSILVAVLDRRLIINLRKTGHYDRLLVELMHSALAFLATLVLALAAILAPNAWLVTAAAISVVSLVYSLAVMVRAGIKFTVVIQALPNRN
jgi:hypothetical protein